MTLALISIGVAMDATAVCAGMAIRGLRFRELLKLAVTFGLFQLAMALLGAVGGAQLNRYMGAWDHWFAFTLLALVGGRMIHEAFEQERDEEEVRTVGNAMLLLLGIATSIDALAIGVILPTLGLPIVASVVVIGVVTTLLSVVGGRLGRLFGERFGTWTEVFGGLVLIGIGVKTLVEHLGG